MNALARDEGAESDGDSRVPNGALDLTHALREFRQVVIGLRLEDLTVTERAALCDLLDDLKQLEQATPADRNYGQPQDFIRE
jgi:hypothetical protein